MTQEIMSDEKATVIITPQVASQISCLHNQCPKNKEWSGLLIYRITEGSIEDRKNLKIQTEAIFPMNFGSETFTEFEGNLDMLSMIEKFPQVDPLSDQRDNSWHIGLIHTHHNMATFFSGTDTTDLHATTLKSKFHLSLIVNYACEPIAKIGVEAKTEKTTVEWFNWELKNFRVKHKKPRKKDITTTSACYIIDCTVLYQQSEWFIEQTKKIKLEAEEKAKVVAYTPGKSTSAYGNSQSQMGFQYGGGYNSQTVYVKPKKDEHGIRGVNPYHYTFKVYQQMLGEVDDLLLLGNSTGYTPYKALDKVAEWVVFAEVEDYKKAVKQYFTTWYYQNFWKGTALAPESEVCYTVLKFLHLYENIWITKHLIIAINEYLNVVEKEEADAAKQSV